MPDHRKPPVHNARRPDGAPPAADSDGFSIESTTMRLKSMKVRRAEKELKEVEDFAKSDSPDSLDMPTDRPSGRVRHDERGMAVWDWAVASGEFDSLSQTAALKKLGVADLNQRGSGKRQGEAAERQGLTGSAERARVLEQLLGKKK